MARISSSSEEVEGEEEKKKQQQQPQQKQKKKKEALGWIEWLRGWLYLMYEMLFQRIIASHLQNPLPLPPANDLSCIVTGSTSGIGREIARFGVSLLSLARTKSKLTSFIITRFLILIFFFLGNYFNRQLAEAGAHVVMAVRNTKAAHELIQKWQTEWSGMGLPLNIEVVGEGNLFFASCNFLWLIFFFILV